jgi:hypothetical protein
MTAATMLRIAAITKTAVQLGFSPFDIAGRAVELFVVVFSLRLSLAIACKHRLAQPCGTGSDLSDLGSARTQ